VEVKLERKPSRGILTSVAPALRSRNFRLFWIAQIVSTMGTALQSLAERWLIFQLTGSYALLGAFGFIALLPVVPIALMGGLIIDRVPRRKLIIFTQTGLMLQAAVFALLVFSGQIKVWHIIVLDSIMGALFAIDQPARQTFLSDIVAGKHLANAIALNATIFQVARTVGTFLSGVLIATVGAGGAMALNALSYVAPLVALSLIRVSTRGRDLRRTKLGAALSEGLKTLFKRPALLGTISVMAVVGGLATTMNLLMPAYAQDVVKTDSIGLGLLLAANAAGAVAATALLGRLGKQRRGFTLIVAGLISAVLVLMVSAWHTMLATTALLFVLGGFVLIVQALANTLVQLGVPEQVRGRVMSIYSLANAGAPMIGGVVVGGLSQKLGLPIAFAIVGATLLVFTGGLNLVMPSVRRQN
jgi:MFS family permease